MSLSVMFGLAEPDLPEGKPYIHNCRDDDEEKPKRQARSKKTGRPHHAQVRRNDSIRRYGDAFAKFGGVATKKQLASVLPEMSKETIHQYLDRHQGDTTKCIGKVGKEYVWRWIWQ